MTVGFSPGHITCVFQPFRTSNCYDTGSRGFGFKLNLGSTVAVEERSDKKINFVMDEKESSCEISKNVLETLCPGRGFDVYITNDLPVSQGFGMSASNALATAVCAKEISGCSQKEAFEAAHCAEVRFNGGLGDVSAIVCDSHVPIRDVPGIRGKTIDSKLKLEMNVAILGDALSTESVIGNKEKSKLISEKGKILIDEFEKNSTEKKLFELSRQFSRETGLETFEISSFLSLFPTSGMCMLGHSVFTTAEMDEITDLCGETEIYPCKTTNELPKIIRKA